MSRITLLNIGFNLLVAAAFVVLNGRAVNAGLEETFVTLALIYGLVTVSGNAIFVAYARKPGAERHDKGSDSRRRPG